jgi:hypothetical protein
VQLERGLGRALAALVALVVVSTAARFALSSGVAAPWIAPDEQVYGLLGRSLVNGDGFRVLGESIPYYSAVYPLLVGLPFLGNEVSDGVRGVQALQALLMSATAVPVYLWGRQLAGARWALLAATLAVLIPGLAYSGLFMSEALYYPVATIATWALASCLTRPTLLRQTFLLGAIALALATRLQAVGFAAAVLAALVLLSLGERSIAPFRRMLPTLAVLGVGVLVSAATALMLGGAGELLGAYAPLAEARSYSVVDVARSISWHTGSLALLTVALPLLALGILAWGMLRGHEADPGVRALVATALAYGAVTVVEVGAFASRFVEHVTERQLLSVAPPLFVVFAVWLQRGLPRPQPAASIIALAVAAPTLLLPLDRVVSKATAVDSPSMIPLQQLSDHVSASALELVYAGAAALLLALAVVVPSRAAVLLAGLVAVPLAAGTLVASREMRELSQIERESTFASSRVDWIDAAGAREATLLMTGDRLWPSVWQEVFWNTSIVRVARFPGAQDPGLLPQVVVVPRPDGHLVTRAGEELAAAYVTAPSTVTLAGERVATVPPSHDQPGVGLWRTETPVRLTQRIVGLRPNGDLYTGEKATIKVFSCGPGTLELTLLGKEGLPTRITVDGVVATERAVPPGKVWRPSIPAPASANGHTVCVYTVQSDGLLGSTRIEWVPAA